MTDLKARWLSLIDEYSAESEEAQPQIDSVSSPTVATKELPIYEAAVMCSCKHCSANTI